MLQWLRFLSFSRVRLQRIASLSKFHYLRRRSIPPNAPSLPRASPQPTVLLLSTLHVPSPFPSSFGLSGCIPLHHTPRWGVVESGGRRHLNPPAEQR
ncbi:hypothetical protein E2C01_019568 [Portunus trituberculatus]|uniref:Uncharacterized protein n=1 Tax=Portunus trituberculatus TaxID=210409 RepID=A0A5B7DZ71_PORTR|nr:hypothetical protein [Portunus trituberculatus]